MKKLMIAVAVVAVAAFAQAASINWCISANPGAKVLDQSGKSVYQQAVYLVDGSDSSIAAIKAILDAGNNSGFDYWESKTTTVPASGMIAAHTFSDDDMTSDKQKFALLLIDNNYGGEGEFAYKFTAAHEVTPGTPTTPGTTTFSAVAPSTDFSGGWTTVAVPEPTSGLLLLLGVAGMALRRRRA